MGIIFKTDKRRIIPRWRSLESASITGELNVVSRKKNPIKFNTTEYLVEQKFSWEKNKNLAYAGDLLSSAYVLGLESEFYEVAKFILNKETDPLAPILRIAKKVLKIEEKTNDVKSNVGIVINNDRSKYFPDVRKFKSYLNSEPRNPIAWIELGRLYSLIGQVKKAQKCIDRALYLDKDNRFIVRSASRFYHHFHGDKDISLQIIKRSNFINHDPWLISAEIAYSSVLGRFSKLTKVGKVFLDEHKEDYFSITELASAVGTVEHSNGKIKDAKKYIKQSLIMPNDNSLAQAEWLSNSIEGLNIDESKFNLPLAYEARALAAYEQERFKSSFENAMRWQLDEPYSIRPVLTASYVAGVFLDDLDLSIALLKSGLEINKDDQKLSNNLVYFLVQNDKIQEAVKIFQNRLINNLSDIDNIDIISHTATAGLLLYRTGHPEEGKKYYMRAIELARRAKADYLLALAMLNFTAEEIKSTKEINSVSPIISQLDKICKNRIEADVKLMYKAVISSYEKLKTNINP